MSTEVFEFDAIAADDALLDAIAEGTAPADDTVVTGLSALSSYASAHEESPGHDADPRPLASTLRRPSRIVAVVAAAGLLLSIGIGQAVAGDPAAPLRLLVRTGVTLGNQLSSPSQETSGMHVVRRQVVHRPVVTSVPAGAPARDAVRPAGAVYHPTSATHERVRHGRTPAHTPPQSPTRATPPSHAKPSQKAPRHRQAAGGETSGTTASPSRRPSPAHPSTARPSASDPTPSAASSSEPSASTSAPSASPSESPSASPSAHRHRSQTPTRTGR